MLEERRLAMEELLLELRPGARLSAARPGRASALLPAPPDLEGGAPDAAFFSIAAPALEESRLVLLSAALVLPELLSPPPLGDVLLGGCELCWPGLFLCWAESGCSTSGVCDEPFLDGVAVLEEAALLVLDAASLFSLRFAPPPAAPLVCARGGSLSTAGEAGDRELEEVEEVAGRFLGLLSLSTPAFPEVLLTSAAPFLCLEGLIFSPAATLLFSPPAWILCSACATALE